VKQTYRWSNKGGFLTLYECGTVRPYDKPALERALRGLLCVECPPGICSFKFYRTRTNNIAKFKQGLKLMND